MHSFRRSGDPADTRHLPVHWESEPPARHLGEGLLTVPAREDEFLLKSGDAARCVSGRPTILCEQSSREHLAPLRHQVLLDILPHYLRQRNLPGPHPGEQVPAYLIRTAKAALDAQDWMLALGAFEAMGAISFGAGHTPTWLSADIASLRALIQGDKQSLAGEFKWAALSYSEALAVTTQNVPLEAIVDRLRTLKKQHPDAFKNLEPKRVRKGIE